MEFRRTTLIFLIKRSGGEIAEICLAMKKRGFGVGRWNGAGGKALENETYEEAAIRETKEELEIEVKDLKKISEIMFHFPYGMSWPMHAYFCEDWSGEPAETEEMKPKWFKVSEIPYAEMWADDEHWLPLVLSGKLVKGDFTFDEKDRLLDKNVKVVESL